VLTPDQQKAVSTQGSVVVTAGAGTGKTFLLTQRFQHYLNSDFSPLQLVAVTFTEKAAHELRSRIRRTLHEELPDRADLHAELEAAQIGTLHALAARICRDHPQLSGVPADFSVVEDIENIAYQTDLLEEALGKLSVDVFESIGYSQLKQILTQLLMDPISAQQALSIEPNLWRDLVIEHRERILRDLLESEEWLEARQILENTVGQAEDLIEQARQQTLQCLNSLSAGDVQAAVARFQNFDLKGGSKKNWPSEEVFKSVKVAIKDLKDRTVKGATDGTLLLEVEAIDLRWAQSIAKIKIAFEQVLMLFEQEKFRTRKLTFADLEVHALRALEHEAVRTHYQTRWKAFLVDEFQDVNPTQARLLHLLTEQAELTIVGDQQQAIYGFRGADVRVFKAFSENLVQQGGHALKINLSFRTHQTLLDRINQCFSIVSGKEYQPLSAPYSANANGASNLEAFMVNAGKSRRYKRKLLEARLLTRRIRQILEGDLTIIDSSTGLARAVAPGDIAVLTRTWQPLEIYNNVFQEAGLPVVHAGGGRLLEMRESKDGMALLRCIADPDDEIALLAVLRSPFFAVSDKQLFEVRRDAPKTPWQEILEETQHPFLSSVATTLEQLRSARTTCTASQLLEMANRLTAYSSVLAHLPGPERRVADWNGFIELIRTLEGGSGDVFHVVRRLIRLEMLEVDVPRPNLQSDNSISLMTIHKAKGLEWPIVILADLEKPANNQTQQVFVDREFGIGVKLETSAGELKKTALYRLLEQRQKTNEHEELKRLMYVGFTRVKSHLILSCAGETGPILNVLSKGLKSAGINWEFVSDL
jgi:ATP-dependent helicase/nuclease subunit A